MKLKPSQIRYIAYIIVDQLKQNGFIIYDDKIKRDLVAKVEKVITEDLMVEDKLNEEVRQILEKYRDYMIREHIEYHKMFATVKRKLIKERGLIL